MLKFSTLFLAFVFTTLAVSAQIGTNDVVINEFLASNNANYPDPDEPDEYPDWIELYNNTDNTIDISGIYITDNLNQPTKWQVPANTSISARGYLILLADKDNEQGSAHTNFKLNAESGIIAIVNTDAKMIIDSLSYQQQYSDISFGRYPDGANKWFFFDTPTPNAKNNQGFTSHTSPVQFSQQRGLFDNSFELNLTCETPGAVIYYTTDGREPSDRETIWTKKFTGPISITTTTTIRARAVVPKLKSSDISTHSYIFIDDVLKQPAKPNGFPTNWAHTNNGDYEMDPDVVDNPNYKNTIKDDMKSIPTLSLVMNVNDWFGANGIYTDGELEERAVSAEYIFPDTTKGFQINCAVMIVGGSSVFRWKMDKLSMRLKFKSEYGASTLKYPLFGDNVTDEFNTIVLDAKMNHTWCYGGGVKVNGRNLTQREIAQYTRDQYVSDIQNAMGGYAPHGSYVHLYLNGLYWGLYWIHERPDEHFAESYFGGDSDDYDIIKHNKDTIVNGSNENYLLMLQLAGLGLSSNSNYQKILQYIDIENFIDYIILNIYVGNWDWAQHNWYASRNSKENLSRWRFHSWDAEHVMEALDANIVDKIDEGSPTYLHHQLLENKNYQMLFRDRLYKHCFNNGILTPHRLEELYHIRLNQVYRAVVGESARWGDNRREIPFTRDNEWITERNWILDTYLPNRRDVVVKQFEQLGIYSDSNTPLFYIDEEISSGGKISGNEILKIENSSGKIFYTTDGYDPMLPFENEEPDKITLVPENADKRVLVPQNDIGTTWYSNTNFDDSDWSTCTGNQGGIGYEIKAGYEDYISLDVKNKMHNDGGNPNPSCYIRILFDVNNSDLEEIKTLNLKMRCDDGFIAYLNGKKIGSFNAPNNPAWNSTSTEQNEAEKVPVSYNISQHIDQLKSGENILAIHGMNIHTSSSDFIITAELVAEKTPEVAAVYANAMEYIGTIDLTETTNINARSFDNGRWSALHQAVFSLTNYSQYLKLTEIHYHPLDNNIINGRELEFIELKNFSDKTIDLGLMHFSEGIYFTFKPGSKLQAGQTIVLASNCNEFEKRYGIPPFDCFDGNLDNSGEKIVLLDALTDTIFSLEYDDKTPWTTLADGAGYSLVLIDTNSDIKNPLNWVASKYIHGSPGEEDIATPVFKKEPTNVKKFQLYQNFPNPFSTETNIRYELTETANVRLEIYNLQGQKVKTLINETQKVGKHSITWTGENNRHQPVSSGIYLMRLDVGTKQCYKKIMRMR